MNTATATVTLTAHMFGRTIVTGHATSAAAWDRVLDIALAQSCRIEDGRFIPQVWIGTHSVDDPSCSTLGTYEIR
jgi:hypothetical protein